MLYTINNVKTKFSIYWGKMQPTFSKKQLEFIANCTAMWNMAHGAVSTGKTVGTLFAFMHYCDKCPDSQLFMCGHTCDTIYENAIRLLLESDQFIMIKPFLTWFSGKRELKYKDKTIKILGAKDEGAIRQIQGKTMSGFYGDEMTLYPESIIDMINTRLRNPHSKGFASMNPTHPNHKMKQWIDKAESGDKNYYALHFTLEDNPFVDDNYKNRIKNSLSGMFYKRNYLGLWCMAEGAIFDFFDKNIHVVDEPPRAAEYWIAGIDYGQNHAFTCILVGISTGRYTQSGKCLWVEKEYYWDPKKESRQKLNDELADDVQEFLEPYAIKNIYMDPSAEHFHLELRRRGMHVVHANNDVLPGISYMTSEMGKGNLFVCEGCKNLIKEIEGYVWDPKEAVKGKDAPLKQHDDGLDALRYAVYTHKVAEYKPYKHDANFYQKNRFAPTRRI